MANFLSGISVGAHQGLANLVASKRADRAAKRDQRRYENELFLRLGEIKDTRTARKEALAYRKSRDEIGDKQWADAHGLRVDMFEADKAYKADTLAETVRSNKAADEDRDADRLQNKEQFDQTLAQRIREQTSRDELSRLGILEGSRQNRETLNFRKQQHLDDMEDRNIGRQLQRESQQTQKDYYDSLIELRKNPTTSPEELRKIEAEIKRIDAQTGYYEAQTRAVGTTGSDGITFPQSRSATGDFAKTFADSFLQRFTDQGSRWTFPYVERQVGEGPISGRLNWPPLRIDNVLPWENPGDPSADTQRKRLRSIGGEAFQGLLQEMNGDVEAAANRIPTFFAELLSDPDRREQFVSYLMHTPLNNPRTGQPYTEIEMLRKAREELLQGAADAYSGMIQKARTSAPAPGTTNDPILDMQ